MSDDVNIMVVAGDVVTRVSAILVFADKDMLADEFGLQMGEFNDHPAALTFCWCSSYFRCEAFREFLSENFIWDGYGLQLFIRHPYADVFTEVKYGRKNDEE